MRAHRTSNILTVTCLSLHLCVKTIHVASLKNAGWMSIATWRRGIRLYGCPRAVSEHHLGCRREPLLSGDCNVLLPYQECMCSEHDVSVIPNHGYNPHPPRGACFDMPDERYFQYMGSQLCRNTAANQRKERRMRWSNLRKHQQMTSRKAPAFPCRASGSSRRHHPLQSLSPSSCPVVP